MLGFVIVYWYIAIPLLVVFVVAKVAVQNRRRRAQEELARHRPGPRDPWLNEIVVAVAEFGFHEYARNTGTQVAGVPIEGDIQLDADRLSVVITLLSNEELAHQAEIGLRAEAEVRRAIADGKTIVTTEEGVLYVANGRGGFVDEHRLDEIVQLVGAIPIGPPRPSAGAVRPTAATSGPPVPGPRARPLSGDILDQIRRLGELHDRGVLTDIEFEAKKAELLRRV